MRLADVERFDAGAVRWMTRLYALALVVEVGTAMRAGVWRVHTGELYPWRHLPLVPLYPAPVLAVEWLATMAAAGMLLVPRLGRIAWRVAAGVTLAAVLQRYSNHGALLFLVAFYAALDPPPANETAFASPMLALVRAQLVIVYAFSALNKLTHGFASGASLGNLVGVPIPIARPLSIAAIVSELALPLVLLRAPRVGIGLVVAMHVAFALAIDGVTSFGIVMTALATTFLRSAKQPHPLPPTGLHTDT